MNDAKRRILDLAARYVCPGTRAHLRGHGHRPGHRPPRGLPHLGHRGTRAARLPSERRRLQPRASPSRAPGGAARRARDARHRQPSLPERGARRARRSAGAPHARRPAVQHLRQRRRRGHRRRHQDRAPRHPAPHDRLDPEGLPRPHRPGARRRRRTLLEGVPQRRARPTSSHRCRSTISTRWRRRCAPTTSPPCCWRRSRRPPASRCRSPAIWPA